MSTHSKTRTTASPSLAPGGWALIVDDHPLFCDALELTLRSIHEFTEIGVAHRLDAALELIESREAPSVVLLDLNLPDVTGLDGLGRMVKAVSPVPVLVVSSLADNQVVTTALKAGAAGFVPKHAPRAIFAAAFDALNSGRIYLPESFTAADVPDSRSQALRAIASLTRQQARILELICDGKLNKQIAHELSIAETTVKAHVTAIMRKLGVQSRTQAVLVANEAKFSTISPDGT